MTGSATSDRHLAVLDRHVQVLQLRKAGLSLDAIGRKLGISASAVHKHLHKALDGYAQEIGANVADLRALELARLDDLYRQAVAIALSPASLPELRLKAIDRALAISRQRAVLLGLQVTLADRAFSDEETIEFSLSIFEEPLHPPFPVATIDGTSVG